MMENDGKIMKDVGNNVKMMKDLGKLEENLETFGMTNIKIEMVKLLEPFCGFAELDNTRV